jgi:NAD(P)-dependent dehydrogenase (short-subunit alcohol dehydrogenase family)
MNRFDGKSVIVTGAASGFGAAIARKFANEGASVVCADLNMTGATEVAGSLASAIPFEIDVADEAQVKALVDDTVEMHGGLDLFVSNAGYVTLGGLEAPNAEMTDMLGVHVMAHLYAARHAIPHMVDQGGGWLLNTASAAGLLTQIGSLAYSVTKNAAVALAEWIAITYGDRGIGVSVLCPQAVESNIRANSPTADLLEADQGFGAAGVDGVMSAEDLAGVVVEGLADGRFHILPHPEVAEYVRRKGDDVDRWLSGMRRFQQRLYPEGPTPADWLTA